MGVVVADTLLRRWPELDATPADCSGPASCFSLSFATVPPTPSPKFWEYTYGVPLAGLQKLFADSLAKAVRLGDLRGRQYNAYVNADVRGAAELSTGAPPAPESCPATAQIPRGTTPPIACQYIYVRDDVPQGFGAVLLASSEMEFTTPPSKPANRPRVARSK